ncbi:MAG TPA: biotin transporter BioY [Vicinamibacterales bacterium]|jgi:biotin transport system substrate-specific component|nr:biotin transporter BioY [Vicinamibacterales bacterium]
MNAGTLVWTLTSRADHAAAIRYACMLFVTALTAAAAQVSVPLPFTAVPFTLQPMVVLIGGAALGSRLGLASQVLYILAGLAGLPVFAASPILPQGAARLIGPTGGYLMAFPLAAFVAGALAERGLDRRYLTSVLAMAAGLAVIFLFGVTWLSVVTPLGVSGAISTGLAPFLPADILKVFIAGAVLPAAWRIVGPRRSGSQVCREGGP